METPGGAAAVDRALAILGAVAAVPAPQSLAELSRATGLYKSTILRLLASLEAARYVARQRDGRYALGPGAFRLGLAYEQANRLGACVLPALRELVEAGTESASFHVRHDATTRLCLFRVNSHHATLDTVREGQLLPLRRGAAGRVLLAFDGEGQGEGQGGGQGRGEGDEAVRQAGYAVSFGERDPLCAGMAGPVFGPAGVLRGALSLSGPRERFDAAAIARALPLLRAAANAVSGALGAE